MGLYWAAEVGDKHENPRYLSFNLNRVPSCWPIPSIGNEADISLSG